MKKKIRTRGKVRLSQMFQELNKGDRVSIVREHSICANFHKRMQGKSGLVTGKKGRSYLVEIKDGNKSKTFIIKPIHLKKLV